MASAIGLYDWPDTPGLDVRARVPRFEVNLGDPEKAFLVVVLISRSLLVTLAAQLAVEGDPDTDPVIDQALLRFGVIRIEQAFASRSYIDAVGVQEIHVREDDLPFIRELLTTKTCSYQVGEGGDLFCSAASLQDKTRVGVLGLRGLAPTTRPTCFRCTLPATDYVCTHLAHPQVLGVPVTGVGAIPPRVVMEASCEADRPEIEQPGPSKCHAGGNSCWTRVLASAAEPDLPTPSPEALAEAFDYLDTAWRLAFENRALLRMRSASDIVGLALPATSREEFESRVSDLDDVIKNWSIDDQLLPAGDGNQGSLAKLQAVLSDRLREDGDKIELVRAALEDLRSINRIRVGYQHSDAVGELPAAFAKLGVGAPASNWTETWDKVRARAVRSLHALVAILRDLSLGED